MIRDLARKLAAFTEFKDFVIIELEFKRGNFDPAAQIVKNSSSRVILQASSKDAEVLVKMIRPRKKISPAIGCRVQSAEKIWKIFTPTEIFEFCAAVDDKNPIHQLNPPIVPGLLILESLCAEFNPNFIKLKFKNFITAGESLTLQRFDNKIEIICAEVVKISGEML